MIVFIFIIVLTIAIAMITDISGNGLALIYLNHISNSNSINNNINTTLIRNINSVIYNLNNSQDSNRVISRNTMNAVMNAIISGMNIMNLNNYVTSNITSSNITSSNITSLNITSSNITSLNNNDDEIINNAINSGASIIYLNNLPSITQNNVANSIISNINNLINCLNNSTSNQDNISSMNAIISAINVINLNN